VTSKPIEKKGFWHQPGAPKYMGAFGESTPDRAIFRKQSIKIAKRIQAIVLYGGGGSWLTYSQNCSTVFFLLFQQCATENNLNKVANYDNGFHACH
jgi:hypothetical protein